MNKTLKEKVLIGLIIMGIIVLVSVLVNGIFLLKQAIQQNTQIISLIESFKITAPVATGDKYQ